MLKHSSVGGLFCSDVFVKICQNLMTAPPTLFHFNKITHYYRSMERCTCFTVLLTADL